MCIDYLAVLCFSLIDICFLVPETFSLGSCITNLVSLFHAPLNGVLSRILGMVGGVRIVSGVVIIRGVGILSQFLGFGGGGGLQ